MVDHSPEKSHSKDSNQFYYNKIAVPPEHVFLSRKYVFAKVCGKPATDGHVMVCPKRGVKSMD